MAHSLGLEVIAEGLETEEQKDFLHLHGCALYQGYLFSPALPVDQFFALVQNQDR
jgi:sensor c-di-GMP phosphodiesterase-like protein